MDKIKISNRELILIIFIIFFGFISIFSLYFLKDKKNSEELIDSFNNGIAKRYVNIINENEDDILKFLRTNINDEFVVVPAMDYVFSNCFKNFSDEGKADLYYFYYDAAMRFQVMYQDLVNVEEYRYHLLNYIDSFDEEVDINDYEIYSKIDLVSLRTLITELRKSHFKIQPNGDYFEVFFDYLWFTDEYLHLLPQTFVDFIWLDYLANTSNIAPERTGINVNAIEELIHASKDYLDSENNNIEGLNFGALYYFRNSLLFLTGGRFDASFIYDDETKYTIRDDIIDYYKKFINDNANSSLSSVMKEVVEICEDQSGKGTPILAYIEEVVDNYLLEYNYATEEDLETLGSNTISTYSTVSTDTEIDESEIVTE